MGGMRAWPFLVLGALLVVGGIVAPGAPPAFAQGEAAPRRETHLGAGSCAASACHGDTKPKANEYTTWIQHDEHSEAYLHLTRGDGPKIAKRLGLSQPAREAPECLSCHAAAPQLYDHGDRYDMRWGVSCEICHGGSTQWLGPHAAPGWKEKSWGHKTALGMRDLSTPEQRVALCAGCHVGGQGNRTVDHDLIAAGHPPLFFDASAFMALKEPQWVHWTDETDLTQRTWFLGQVANLVAYLGRIERSAEDEKRWPDYAVFDCYSCHHDLDKDGHYATTEAVGPIGRPPFDAAFTSVLGRALAEMKPAAAQGLQTLGESLSAAYRNRDRAAVRESAASGASQARQFATAVESLDQAAASRILAWFDEHLDATEGLDHRIPRHEALQIAWAIHALVPNRQAQGFRAAYDELAGSLSADGAYDPGVFAKKARAAIAAGR